MAEPATAQTKEEATSSLRGASTTLRSLARTDRKKDDSGTTGSVGSLSGNHLGRAALRREQREQLESEYRENQDSGKEGETDHRRHKNSL
jgi:hypothetical protein